MSVSDYSSDPDLNTSISGINIAEGCPPSGINNAIRQMMADIKTADGEVVHLAGAETISGAKTITGSIVNAVSNGVAVRNANDDGMTVIRGGTDSTDGAYAVLYGKDASGTEGQFILRAQDGVNSTSLTGTPSGGLTWGVKAVERVHASSFANLAGYIRYANGLQIAWGRETSVTAARSITFAVPFAHTPIVIDTSNKSVSTYITSPSTTGCTLNCSAYSSSTAVNWIAVGDWA